MTGDSGAREPGWRFLGMLVGLGFAWRVFVSWRTPMPREDGVNYLWMAQQFAAGDPCAALGEIFSPLLSLLIAVPVACGLEPFVAGQLVLAAVGSLVVVPVVRISDTLAPGTGWFAGLLIFVAWRPVQLGAWIYTEPLFLLLAAYAFLAGLRQRYWMCGLLSAVAFWIRPEAAVLPAVFLLVARFERRAWVALLPLAIGIGALAVSRGLCGHGYDPVPKLQFILAHNVAEDESGLQRLVQIPGRVLEAFGAMGLLAVYGLFRRPSAPVRRRELVCLLAIATVIIWSYAPRWRFFVNWMFAVAPLAAVGVARLPGRRWGLALVVGLDLWLATSGGSPPDRIAERRVGEHLRSLLRPGEIVTGDMTRVLYFAGCRPLPPRHFAASELIDAAARARFVVLRSRRPTTPAVRVGLAPRFARMAFADGLAALAERRGMEVWSRRK